MKLHFVNIYWDMTTDIKRVMSSETPITPKELKTKLPIKKSDRIALVYFNTNPVYEAPIRGTTLHDLLKSLEKGLNIAIQPTYENTKFVYQSIALYYKPEMRLKLVKKFEQGKLTPLELNGDYTIFAGSLRREAGGIWTYALEG